MEKTKTSQSPETILLPGGKVFTLADVPQVNRVSAPWVVVRVNPKNAYLQFSTSATDDMIKEATHLRFYTLDDSQDVVIELIHDILGWPPKGALALQKRSKKHGSGANRGDRVSAQRLVNAGIFTPGRYSLERVPGKAGVLLAKRVD